MPRTAIDRRAGDSRAKTSPEPVARSDTAARPPQHGPDSPAFDTPRQTRQLQRMSQLRALAPQSVAPHLGGLPPPLRAGIESLSGLDMSGVRVHRNSGKPEALQAHAYAQGQDIHLAPGQDRHLPHEAWHVVQQAQGRVRPTLQMKDGIAVNDQAGLEREANLMGDRAAALGKRGGRPDAPRQHPLPARGTLSALPGSGQVHQREVKQDTTTNRYYSDMNPDVDFDSQAEAEAFETEMQAPEPGTGGRAPTLYTYMSTKSHCKISSRGIPQGPHTLGYAAITEALFSSLISPENLQLEQCLDPSQWRDAVVQEFNDPTLLDGNTETSRRVLRAYADYNGLWQELKRVLKGEVLDVDPKDLVHELIQLGPYSVYKYTDPESVTHGELKYKGESSDLSDPRNVDILGQFQNQQAYREMVSDRMLLLDNDYVPSDQSSDEGDSESLASIDEDELMASDGESSSSTSELMDIN